MNDSNTTLFAVNEKLSEEEIELQISKIKNSNFIDVFINSIYEFVMILNQRRQILFVNQRTFEVVNLNEGIEIYGFRPGEAFGCINSDVANQGCGTKTACKYCGAVNTILKCIETEKKVEEEVRFNLRRNNYIINIDVLLEAFPIMVESEIYVMCIMKDISDKKRKEALEKIFFHDVLNKVNGLNGLIELLKMTNELNIDTDIAETIDLMKKSSNELISEIVSQRDLLLAEKNELELNIHKIETSYLLRSLIKRYQYNEVFLNKKVEVDEEFENFTFYTDNILLERVINNLVKNAFEASEEGQVVKIGCMKKGERVLIWVNNKREMDESVKYQVFSRSFSTKGNNRGLGTYSVKLLTERYLKGVVTFESNESKGTTFYLDLPLNLNIN